MRVERIGDATLYLGDCMEILPTLPKVDAVITDPPYGIGFDYASYDDTRENLRALIAAVIPWATESAKRAVVLCGITQMHEYPAPDWTACITWDTTGSFGKCGYTQWMPALVYGKDVAGFGNVEGRVTKSDVYRIVGGAGVGFARGEAIDHPCPKPVNVMGWAVSRFATATEMVLDPFMGSGTTGVACAQMGRKFIGIEIEPRYFDIACRRIDDAYRQQPLIPHVSPKAEQQELI
jgi:site-specific DNA-methyltransferase (adenine-specific)/modification methylase